MSFMRRMKRLLCTVLAFSVFTFGIQGVATAGIVTTNDLVTAEQSQLDRAQLKTWLSKDEVQQQLVAMGVDADAAKSRVDTMTDEEVQTMAARMDEMPAGAGFIETAVLAFLVLVVLEVTGVTDVLPNI